MKLATIIHNHTAQACIVNTDNMTYRPLHISMQEVIENFPRNGVPESCEGFYPLKEESLLAPIPYPRRNVLCLGKNYLEHVKEIKGITGGPKDKAPDYPIYFTKAAYPCNHHGGTVLRHPEVTEKIDYEVELVAVIGKRAHYIRREDALDYVFGYTVGNDISARDVQTRHVNWFMGKSLTTHCPVGPYIVTKDEIPDPQTLKIRSLVNDELRQDGNTADMIWTVADIIYEISQGYELLPGDMIMTGTPKGVGMGFNPPKFLNPGDKITCTIEKVGTLVNYMEK